MNVLKRTRSRRTTIKGLLCFCPECRLTGCGPPFWLFKACSLEVQVQGRDQIEFLCVYDHTEDILKIFYIINSCEAPRSTDSSDFSISLMFLMFVIRWIHVTSSLALWSFQAPPPAQLFEGGAAVVLSTVLFLTSSEMRLFCVFPW